MRPVRILPALVLCGLTVGVAAATPPPFLLKWGTLGSANAQFDTPSGIAVDANGNCYVADRNNNRIEKFAPSGAFVTAWGSLGTGNGQFNSPRDVAVDAAGNVYVADSQNDRIQKFTSAGAFLLKWGSTGNGPGQFRSPRAVAVDRTGTIYVAEDGFPEKRIQRFTNTGAYLTGWGTLGVGEGQFASPRGVAVDDNGFVYVSDTQNHRIQKFTATGGFVTTWGTSGTGPGEFSFPIGICWFRDRLYVVDSQNHRVQVFDRNGDFRMQFGSRCRLSDGLGCSDPDGAGPLQLGDGGLNFPQAIALRPGGELFITDTDNHRVVKYGTSPTDVEGAGLGDRIHCRLASANPGSGVAVVHLDLPARRAAGDPYQVRARVFDVVGRLVQELPPASFNAGAHTLSWNGLTSTGRATAPGVYFLSIAVDGAMAPRIKLVRLQ